ncbi:DUF4432 family protein [Nakamurella antarctica]|uniref:DUF4432 family protein n=1 Tax=Nakamurella antarctica TaxID=1902245 RepID=UPI0013DDD50C|nr:DUF4432 family protein [Nakamurella antarctica]
MQTLDLSTADLFVAIDPQRGADILSLTDRRTGVDVLFRTPWRERADAIRDGQQPSTFDTKAGWLEQYRGGWQTLAPNAGDPRQVHGAPLAFHGEASVAAWSVDDKTEHTARLHVELFSVPVRIDRTIRLTGPTISIIDTLTNLSTTALEFDYSHHPAFGGAFLDGTCRIETGARRFTSDEQTTSIRNPGSEHQWPYAVATSGDRLDLREIPAPGSPRELFGWLHDFQAHWASITNLDLDLTARIEWDGELLPYAWLWQELNASDEFPWYKRARAVAIEPASMQTSGPGRRSVLRLGANVRVEIPISVTLESATRHSLKPHDRSE